MGTPNNVNKPTKTMDPWFVEEGPASPAVEHAATAKYKPEGGRMGVESGEKREKRKKGKRAKNILLCVISTEQNEKRRLLCFEPLPCGPTSLLV